MLEELSQILDFVPNSQPTLNDIYDLLYSLTLSLFSSTPDVIHFAQLFEELQAESLTKTVYKVLRSVLDKVQVHYVPAVAYNALELDLQISEKRVRAHIQSRNQLNLEIEAIRETFGEAEAQLNCQIATLAKENHLHKHHIQILQFKIQLLTKDKIKAKKKEILWQNDCLNLNHQHVSTNKVK